MEIFGLPLYNIFCYFIIFAVVGYVCEVIYAALVTGKFVNRGFLSGPWCPIYGFGIIIVVMALRPLYSNPLLLFLGSILLTSALEYFTGYILEKLLHQRWWDYSDEPFNIGGYVCLRYSLLWGVACVLMLRVALPVVDKLIGAVPKWLMLTICGAILAVILVDLVVTLLSVAHLNEKLDKLDEIQRSIRKGSDTIGGTLSKETLELKSKYDEIAVKLGRGEKRLIHSFPNLKNAKYRESLAKLKAAYDELSEKHKAKIMRQKTENAAKYDDALPEGAEKPFAWGFNYSKLFALFFIGCVSGFLLETLWALLNTGKFEMRVGLVIGPFIPVYGFGAVVITLALYKLRKQRDLWIFLGSGVIGALFEYVCSLFQEVVFGTVSWEYSDTPLNLGGRTNLMFAFFWGLLGLVWVKDIYPRVSKLIEKIPKKLGMTLTVVLSVFMAADMVLSSVAVLRDNERREGIEAQNSMDEFLDEYFDDDYMDFVFPNMIPADEKDSVKTDSKGTIIKDAD